MSEKKTTQREITAKPLDRAWLAGVMESRRCYWTSKNGTTPKKIVVESTDGSMINRIHQVAGCGEVSDREKAGVNYVLYTFRTKLLDDTRQVVLTTAPFLSQKQLFRAAEVVGGIERTPGWQIKNKDIERVAAKMENRAQENG